MGRPMQLDKLKRDFKSVGEDFELFKLTAGTELDKIVEVESDSAEVLAIAFPWAFTTQGYRFWSDIYRKLLKLN